MRSYYGGIKNIRIFRYESQWRRGIEGPEAEISGVFPRRIK